MTEGDERFLTSKIVDECGIFSSDRRSTTVPSLLLPSEEERITTLDLSRVERRVLSVGVT
jgi:hypothetical protein